MPSIFFGFSGAGGGVGILFLLFRDGRTGPRHRPGPPASAGASCLFGFWGDWDGGCWGASCAVRRTAPQAKINKTNVNSKLTRGTIAHRTSTRRSTMATKVTFDRQFSDASIDAQLRDWDVLLGP